MFIEIKETLSSINSIIAIVREFFESNEDSDNRIWALEFDKLDFQLRENVEEDDEFFNVNLRFILALY